MRTWWDHSKNLLRFTLDLPKSSPLLKEKNIDIHLMEHGDLRTLAMQNDKLSSDIDAWAGLGGI